MKNKIITAVLLIVMIFLIAAIAIFAGAIYFDVTDQEATIFTINSIETSVEENLISNQTTEVENIQLNINSVSDGGSNSETSETNVAEENYYYSQLSDTQKAIYDGLLENKENMMSGQYKVEYGSQFSDVLDQEGGEKQLGDDYQSAVEAYLYDSPDIFYIDANKLYLNVETTSKIFTTTYNVYIGPAEGSTYYVDGFETESQVKEALSTIENTRDSILRNLTGDNYKDILKIHDYLVDTIDYDKQYSSIGTYSLYGAFIDKTCVCEGYAKALKYLLNAIDIECEIVQGTATSSTGNTENHAWNCVNLNGTWYYIDATWDDPIIIGEGSVAKSVQYKYFLKGSDTMSSDHTLEYQFSDGGKVFRYPEVSKKDYN